MMTDDEIETAARAIATRRNLSHPTVEQWIQCCDDARAEAAYQADQDAIDQHNAAFDRWESMTDCEREHEISAALRLAS